MSKRRTHSPEFKARVAMEAISGRKTIQVGLPRFQGQVDRGHAMTTRLSIDELTHQDQASIHGAAKGGGC